MFMDDILVNMNDVKSSLKKRKPGLNSLYDCIHVARLKTCILKVPFFQVSGFDVSPTLLMNRACRKLVNLTPKQVSS